MKTQSQARDAIDDSSQIVGFRIPQTLAREVKAEAGRRGIKLNQLFVELWQDYKGHTGKGKDS